MKPVGTVTSEHPSVWPSHARRVGCSEDAVCHVQGGAVASRPPEPRWQESKSFLLSEGGLETGPDERSVHFDPEIMLLGIEAEEVFLQ